MIYFNGDIKQIHYNGYTIKSVYSCGGSLVWSGNTPPTPHDYSTDYFTMVTNAGMALVNSGSSVEYSIDNGRMWANAGYNTVMRFEVGETILFKHTRTSNNETFNLHFYPNYETQVDNLQITLQGNIMSLIYGDDFADKYTIPNSSALAYAFTGISEAVVDAENLVLPATTLKSSCYQGMFQGCNKLTKSPKILPATTLATSCYDNMFNGCSSLTTSPELPAETLALYSYYAMFTGCNSLATIKCLATDISATQCTTFWTSGVASNGIFIKNPNMSSWTTGSNGIPNGWITQDT